MCWAWGLGHVSVTSVVVEPGAWHRVCGAQRVGEAVGAQGEMSRAQRLGGLTVQGPQGLQVK